MRPQAHRKPNLEYLRKSAKDLLRALRADEPGALEQMQRWHPRWAAGAPSVEVKLSDAQLVVAREAGFGSWPKLVAGVAEGQRSAALERAIDALRAGKMVALFDDEERENEGDLCVAAEHVSAEHINFMTRYGRGTLCVALQQDQAARLGLPERGTRSDERRPPMVASIDAARGVTTGVSAGDRCATIKRAVDSGASAQDVVSPGHVVVLVAHPRGLEARRGHTEGSLALTELAGLAPASVVCEILRDDGSMARLPDVQALAAEHDLPLVSLNDLAPRAR